MSTILQRAIVPLVLLVAGVVSVIYGEKHHVIEVVQEHEEEISIPIPAPFMPGPPGPEGNGPPGGFPGQEPPFGPPGSPGEPGEPPMDRPPWPPPPMFEKVIKKTIETTDEPEPKIVREVSVGGVTLTDGEIKRTYSGDQGPALCPT